MVKYEELFNELVDSETSMILNFIYVSLISSDTIIDLVSCNKSKDELQKMLEALKLCDIKQEVKEEWKKRIEMGLEICERDRQNFISEISHEKC